jgi:ABC-type amino acid transport substrate-binding protein
MSCLLRACLATVLLCAASWTAVAAEPLRVGVSPDYEPLMFMRDGEIVGIEADNAREIGKLLGRPVESVAMPFEELIPALEAGRVDVVMSGLTATEERRKRVLFADPFMEVGQMAVILVDNAGVLSSPGALYSDNIRVGVEPDTTGEAYAKDTLDHAEVKQFANQEEAFAALRQRQIDFYIHDAPTSWKLSESRGDQDLLSLFRPLTNEHLAWAVARHNTRLIMQLNNALAVLRDNGRLRAIQNYWIPTRVTVQ